MNFENGDFALGPDPQKSVKITNFLKGFILRAKLNE